MTDTKRMRNKKKYNGAIAVMAVFIFLILLSTALLFLPKEDTKKKNPVHTPTAVPTGGAEELPETEEVLAVVLDTDTEVKLLTVYNVKTEEQQKLVYTGATKFYDGHGVQHTASQLEKGGLYRFTIDTKEEWISVASEAVDRREKPENTAVWEKTGVDYMTFSQDKINFRGQNYRYSAGLCVMSNGKKISMADINPTMDVVTIRGEGQTIYEIVVTRGHGTITLKNHEDFIGGIITIGKTRVDSILEDSVYLVKEGTYEVSVECGQYSGTETITVARDEAVVFDVFDYGSGPIKKGWLTIHIDPLGADLYIDGTKTTYTDGIELEYGTYQFEFAEGGYVSYKATVLIDRPKQSLSVYLTEQEFAEEPEEDVTTDPNGSAVEDDEDTNTGTEDENRGDDLSGIMNSVSVRNMGYELDMDHATYILGPDGATILLDGVELGTAPMDFESIIGSYVITVIRKDGAVKLFNCEESGGDVYYNFSWID